MGLKLTGGRGCCWRQGEELRAYGDRPVFAFSPSFEFQVHQKRGAIATGCQATRPCLIIQQPGPISVISRSDTSHLILWWEEKKKGKQKWRLTAVSACSRWHHGCLFWLSFLLKRMNGDGEERQWQQPEPYLFRGQCEYGGREAASKFHFSANPQIMWTQFSSTCVGFWPRCLGSVPS